MKTLAQSAINENTIWLYPLSNSITIDVVYNYENKHII